MKCVCVVQNILYDKGSIHELNTKSLKLEIARKWFRPCRSILPIYYYKLRYLFI